MRILTALLSGRRNPKPEAGEWKFTQLSGCPGSWELARLTTGDAVGDLKSPSSSPFPFPGPSVACMKHRSELQVSPGWIMPRNIFQVVTGIPMSY